MAQRFAEPFGSSEWGWLGGLWHDLGKHANDFQAMILGDEAAHLEGTSRVIDHSSAGAVLARNVLSSGGLPLAFAVAGHHAGLDDKQNLLERLIDKAPRLEAARAAATFIDDVYARVKQPALPSFLSMSASRDRAGKEAALRRFELWIRMLYSALVDADFLDTERFYDQLKAAERGEFPAVDELSKRLDEHLGLLIAKAPDTPVNRARSMVLEQCRQAAEKLPGMFRLTVPTGGGKTLAGLCFALRHAMAHDLRRVVAVIPFTSIIEQNADVFRRAIGDEAVVEHHSALDPTEETRRSRLACENWDAPVVVTTSVQFFESLFANRSSRCRKLHRLARCVIVLDEVQSLPPGKLAPILDALRDLVECYGSSIVLCTATQPALTRRESFSIGLDGIRPILSGDLDLTGPFRRVRVVWPKDLEAPVAWPELAARFVGHERALAIVHRRKDARDLLAEVDAAVGHRETFHLSALMCGAHRSSVLDEVRNALLGAGPVRVVSTQLVEAGVDLDFPVVFRAMAGLDAVAQAAGRCNREGRLVDTAGRPVLGLVEVFVAPTEPPAGVLRAALGVARSMLAANPRLDLQDPAVFERYFRSLYFTQCLDDEGIQADRMSLKFKEVARKFRMIDSEGTVPVVVRWGEAAKLIEQVRYAGPSRALLRALQRYVVTVSTRDAERLEQDGAIELVADTVRAIAKGYEALYDKRVGLRTDGVIALDPSMLIK